MSDMISRADAIEALMEAGLAFGYGKAVDIIRALPAVEVGVRELEWFEVEKYRYGGKYTSEGYTIRYIEGFFLLDFAGNGKTVWRFPTIEAAKAAAQADYAARIRSAMTATPAQDVAGLAEDAGLLLDAYKAVLVLHRVMDRHGLTSGALAAENIADRIVAAHPEFPALCAFRGAAIAHMKEASPRPINWRDDQEAVVEDDEPMIGRDYE